MITFNHNGTADGPSWDDVAYGALREAIRMVDNGDPKRALYAIDDARNACEDELAGREGS